MDVTLHKHALNTKREMCQKKQLIDTTCFSQKCLAKELISELYEYCKRDYEMFGYPQPRAMTSQMNVM